MTKKVLISCLVTTRLKKTSSSWDPGRVFFSSPKTRPKTKTKTKTIQKALSQINSRYFPVFKPGWRSHLPGLFYRSQPKYNDIYKYKALDKQSNSPNSSNLPNLSNSSEWHQRLTPESDTRKWHQRVTTESDTRELHQKVKVVNIERNGQIHLSLFWQPVCFCPFFWQ